LPRRKRVKAAVFHKAEDITVEEVPNPRVEPHGVVIKVKASGICGSDVHRYLQGGRDGMILGHEFAGDVVEIGSDVGDVRAGDRVVAMSGRGCGQCYWCRSGQFIRCSKLQLLSYGFPGGFAEYVAVPYFKIGQYAARLPSHLTYEEGATAEPLSVALYAVQQTQPQPGDTVVVIGMGIIGLCIVQILKSMGITEIVASGRREKRLQLAKEGGAKLVVDAAKDDVVPVVSEFTAGKGADVVFEVAGFESTFQQSLKMVHRGGKVGLVGLYEKPFAWSPSSIVGNDITLVGVGLRWDLPGAVELMDNGKVNTKPMVTHEFPLDRIKEAFDTQVKAPDAIKVVVKP
jgi:2-desacetyl-2-hydroxyethyl bacteriochlorophyllide A dehydrogenase